jgi:cysteine desulfurase
MDPQMIARYSGGKMPAGNLGAQADGKPGSLEKMSGEKAASAAPAIHAIADQIRGVNGGEELAQVNREQEQLGSSIEMRKALEQNPDKRHIITTRVEHEAVRNLCEHLAQIGCKITWLEVDQRGELDLDDLRKALRRDTGIVSVMLANNETGVLFPIAEIGRIIRENSDAVFHVDGVQALGKVPINLRDLPVDLFSVAGHKFHAPKGIGALFIRRGVQLPPFIIGGGQERGRRSGTEAVPNVVALGRASELANEFSGHDDIRKLRDRLEDEILTRFSCAHLNGTSDRSKRLPNTSNISFAGFEGSEILTRLDAAGICVSTGSACNAESDRVSAVLTAMRTPHEIARGSIRFSLGRYNTQAEIDQTIDVLSGIVR